MSGTERLYIGGAASNRMIGGEIGGANPSNIIGAGHRGGNIFDDIGNGIKDVAKVVGPLMPAIEYGAKKFLGGRGEYRQLMHDQKQLGELVRGFDERFVRNVKHMPKKVRNTVYTYLDNGVRTVGRTATDVGTDINAKFEQIHQLMQQPGAVEAIGRLFNVQLQGDAGRAAPLERYWNTVRQMIAHQYNSIPDEQQRLQFVDHIIRVGWQGVVNGRQTRPFKLHENDARYPALAPLVQTAEEHRMFGSQVREIGSVRIGALEVSYGVKDGVLVSTKSGKPLSERTVTRILAGLNERERRVLLGQIRLPDGAAAAAADAGHDGAGIFSTLGSVIDGIF